MDDSHAAQRASHRVERALAIALDHLGAQSGTIHLKQRDALVLELAASHGIPPQVEAIVRLVPWGKGMAGLAALRAEPVDACNLQTDTSGDVRPGARATGVGGALVVPMLVDGRVTGTLGIGCAAERTFTPAETQWLLDHAAALARGLG